jgi:hypothetical protein
VSLYNSLFSIHFIFSLLFAMFSAFIVIMSEREGENEQEEAARKKRAKGGLVPCLYPLFSLFSLLSLFLVPSFVLMMAGSK